MSKGLTPAFLSNLEMTADEAASLIPSNAVLGLSGFTRAGDVKAVPAALARRAAHESLQLTVATGASLGHETDALLAKTGILARRYPFQADPTLRRAINDGKVMFIDHHLSETAEAMRSGALTPPDVAIIEALDLDEQGLIPTTSVGNSPVFAALAKSIIVELNSAHSEALRGVHDICQPKPFGQREPIGIVAPNTRIGTPFIPVDPAKIKAVVRTNQADSKAGPSAPSPETDAIAGHLLEFLDHEVKAGRLDRRLAPLQAGIGKIANSVLAAFTESSFEALTMYSEVLQDSTFDLFDSGKLIFASASSITLDARQDALKDFGRYRDRVILRPQDISNHPEVVRRLGVIAINTALEADIYGNVNSTHVNGSHMMNGIGGLGDFARNARLSVFVTQSVAKDGALSRIVPMVPHVDHGAQDVDILVTEAGLADLRGLAPRERALTIIRNCMNANYRELALDYFNEAKRRGGHTPHVLEKAFSWHERAQSSGSMLDTAGAVEKRRLAAAE